MSPDEALAKSRALLAMAQREKIMAEADGATEADIFKKKLAEALVAHLRVGVEP